MSQIITFLTNEVEEAHKNLDKIEALLTSDPGAAIWHNMLIQARSRVGETVQARTTYLDEIDYLRKEVEHLNDRLRPAMRTEFAKQRTENYKRMAYMLNEAVEEAVQTLSGVTNMSKVRSARERLEKALRDRTALSRGK